MMQTSNSRRVSFQKSRGFALAFIVLLLPILTGCWVQSVYPFYEDSDVVVDNSLAGTWSGEGELQPCLLNIAFDSGQKTVNIALSKSGEVKAGLTAPELPAQRHLVHVSAQPVLDVVPR